MTIYKDADYLMLLDLFIKLVNSRSGVKTTPENVWENDAQTLAVKLFYHLTAMHRLINEVKFDHEKGAISFIDHASVKVITRAAFEAYLVFFYLFSAGDKALSAFRHKTWVLGGLADRQKTFPLTDVAKQKLENEKAKMEKLKSEIHREASREAARRRVENGQRLASFERCCGI
jgi:hypothetical protein